MESLSLDEKPAQPQQQQNKKKNPVKKVIIKRENRTKRKVTCTIKNLDLYGKFHLVSSANLIEFAGVDLKKAAKQFANRFACGSSVTKSAEGTDEIVVQGDVQDELEDFILENFSQVPGNMIELVTK